MEQTIFEITKMDCPSEENLIRLRLDSLGGISHLDFDLASRQLTVYHTGSVTPIAEVLSTLQLGEKIIGSATAASVPKAVHSDQRRLLWTVLFINFAFFILEMLTGLFSHSMGLTADSLDMLADSFVYGISLLAVGSTVTRKKRVVMLSGYFQLLLAIIGFAEVIRRFFGHATPPDFTIMIVMALLAAIANSWCLYLLQRSRHQDEAHLQASMIFTSNDVIINLGVIIAGVLVHLLQSNKPDLIIGTIVFAIVIRGAIRILKLAQ